VMIVIGLSSATAFLHCEQESIIFVSPFFGGGGVG